MCMYLMLLLFCSLNSFDLVKFAFFAQFLQAAVEQIGHKVTELIQHAPTMSSAILESLASPGLSPKLPRFPSCLKPK